MINWRLTEKNEYHFKCILWKNNAKLFLKLPPERIHVESFLILLVTNDSESSGMKHQEITIYNQQMEPYCPSKRKESNKKLKKEYADNHDTVDLETKK